MVLPISSLVIATAQNEHCCSLLMRSKQPSSRGMGQGHTPQLGEGSRSCTTAGGRVKVTHHSRGKGQGHAPEWKGQVTHHSRGKGHGRTPQQGEGSKSNTTAGGRVTVTHHSTEKGQGRAPQQGEGSRSHATVGGRVKVTRHREGAETDAPQVFTDTVTVPRLTLLRLLPSPTSLCVPHDRQMNPSKEVLRQGIRQSWKAS